MKKIDHSRPAMSGRPVALAGSPRKPEYEISAQGQAEVSYSDPTTFRAPGKVPLFSTAMLTLRDV